MIRSRICQNDREGRGLVATRRGSLPPRLAEQVEQPGLLLKRYLAGMLIASAGCSGDLPHYNPMDCGKVHGMYPTWTVLDRLAARKLKRPFMDQ